jgi:hypothetical protein
MSRRAKTATFGAILRRLRQQSLAPDRYAQKVGPQQLVASGFRPRPSSIL